MFYPLTFPRSFFRPVQLNEGHPRGYYRQLPGNIREEDNDFVIEMAVPGVKRDELEINVEQDAPGDYLSVRVRPPQADSEAQSNEQSQEPRYLHREAELETTGLSRRFHLGKGLSHESIEARLEDGILRIRIAKKEPVRKSIMVE